MSTILVTGANRGIGLEFVKQYLDKGDSVIATYREEESSKELSRKSGNIGERLGISKSGTAQKAWKSFSITRLNRTP